VNKPNESDEDSRLGQRSGMTPDAPAASSRTMHVVRSRRFSPNVHAVAVTFAGALLGFGVAVAALGAVSGSWTGILSAAAILTATGAIVDIGVRVPGHSHDVLWLVASLLWFVVGVPIAAYLAPDYTVLGFGANVLVIVIVTVCEVSASRASPWRTRWETGGR